MHMLTGTQIATPDHADTQAPLIPILVVIAAIEAAIASSDAFPQLTNQLRLVNIPTHLIAIKKESRMDVITPILPLLTLQM